VSHPLPNVPVVREITVDVAATFFSSAPASPLTLDFRQVGALFGQLPIEAWRDQDWWDDHHEWSAAWHAFGRCVESADLTYERVRFSAGQVQEAEPHPTVRMTSPFAGETVDVDQALSGLIDEIWRHGWRTNACCQRSTGLDEASVSFLDSRDGFDFVDAARPQATCARTWRVVVRAVPGVDGLRAHVYFPATDIGEAIEQLRQTIWGR
jgi:hypothetical protein